MKYFIYLFTYLLFSCSNQENNKFIVLQPLGNLESNSSQKVLERIKLINPNVVIRNQISFPSNSYYKPRNRFRADSIIKFLKNQIGKDSIIVGLTNKDISTTLGKYKDWGVMGLGYRPGNACVISNFRLSNKNKEEQFYKVILHELGHTEGLDHCSNKTCLMRDAEGGNPLNQEKNFCTQCKKYLKRKGWNLK